MAVTEGMKPTKKPWCFVRPTDQKCEGARIGFCAEEDVILGSKEAQAPDGGETMLFEKLVQGLIMTFILLFFCVVARPLIQLTLGPSLKAWGTHLRSVLPTPRRPRCLRKK